LKPTKFVTGINKTLCHPSHPTDIFATQILGSHVTSCNQGLSSNDQRRQRRESLGKRFTIYAGSVESRKEGYKLYMGHLVIIIQGLKRELLNISVVQSTRNYKTALIDVLY